MKFEMEVSKIITSKVTVDASTRAEAVSLVTAGRVIYYGEKLGEETRVRSVHPLPENSDG